MRALALLAVVGCGSAPAQSAPLATSPGCDAEPSGPERGREWGECSQEEWLDRASCLEDEFGCEALAQAARNRVDEARAFARCELTAQLDDLGLDPATLSTRRATRMRVADDHAALAAEWSVADGLLAGAHDFALSESLRELPEGATTGVVAAPDLGDATNVLFANDRAGQLRPIRIGGFRLLRQESYPVCGCGAEAHANSARFWETNLPTSRDYGGAEVESPSVPMQLLYLLAADERVAAPIDVTITALDVRVSGFDPERGECTWPEPDP